MIKYTLLLKSVLIKIFKLLVSLTIIIVVPVSFVFFWLLLSNTDWTNVLKITEKQLQTIDKIAEKHEQNRSEFTRTHFLNLLNNYNEKTDNKIR